ncbi:MAG: type II CAAX endopeptidase family protein [Actinoplanes sp.]
MSPRLPRAARLVLLLLIFVGVDAVLVAIGGNLFLGLAGAAAALGLYVVAVRFLERRPVTELARPGAAGQLGRGALIGFGLFTTVVLIIAVFGGYGLDGWGSFGGMLSLLGLMAAVAVAEEILFRGVLFRIVEEWTGTWGALAVSAVVFGGLHLLNPGGTLVGAIAVMVAGAMVAAAYAWTRTLWLPIGLHFGWNFTESGLFGAIVSGSDDRTGLLRSVFDGPAALSGGSFGPEAGLPAILVALVATFWFLRRAGMMGPREKERTVS